MGLSMNEAWLVGPQGAGSASMARSQGLLTPRVRKTWLLLTLIAALASLAESAVPTPRARPVVAMQGGGINFWHQAGAIEAARAELGRDHFNSLEFVGGSAGSLAAVLSATGVDMDDAFSCAIDLSLKAGLWERPLGLAGVWGDIVRDWLSELLPTDAHALCSGRVTILAIRTLPIPARERVSQFDSKTELIDSCMASCHIPLFLDGRFTARLRGGRYIDGSFLTSRKSYRGLDGGMADAWFDASLDPDATNDFLRLRTPDGVRELFESGRRYAQSPHQRIAPGGFVKCLASQPVGIQ